MEDDDGDDFVPLEHMPTSRLRDVMNNMELKPIGVVNLDACLPPKEAGEAPLQTIFYKMPTTVKVLSVRFNNLSHFSVEVLIDWISQNTHLEMLYTMGSNIDDKNRILLEHAWKKNLVGHRTDNMGYTFIRVLPEIMIAAAKAEEIK